MIFYLSKSWVRLKVRYIGANADRRFGKELEADVSTGTLFVTE